MTRKEINARHALLLTDIKALLEQTNRRKLLINHMVENYAMTRSSASNWLYLHRRKIGYETRVVPDSRTLLVKKRREEGRSIMQIARELDITYDQVTYCLSFEARKAKRIKKNIEKLEGKSKMPSVPLHKLS